MDPKRIALMVITMGLSLSAPLAHTAKVRAGTVEPSSISDGRYVGSWALIGSYDVQGGTTVSGNWRGELDFVSQAGAVEGTWTITGSADVTNESGSGTAVHSGGGSILGASDMPKMAVLDILSALNATVMGLPVDTVTHSGPGEPFAIPLVSATCNQVVGDMPSAAVQNLQSAGFIGASSFTGSWVAFRKEGLAVDDEVLFNREIGDLVFQAEDFKTRTQTSQLVDWHELNGILSKAENLARSIQEGSCGTSGSGIYLLPITQVMDDIVQFALDNPAAFGNSDLARLMAAMARVGLVGPGASNPARAIELEAEYIRLVRERLEQAREDNDCGAAIDLAVGVASLGNGGLLQEAQATLVAVCGDF